MKHLIKIINFILVTAMLLTCIPMSAMAADAPADAAVLLETIGIFDGTEAEKITSGETLTRAGAAYYAVKTTGVEQIPKASKYVFSDMPEGTPYADAVMYGLNSGMIAASGEFYPDQPATVAEFIKMVCAGLGYTQIADVLGGYPDGYMTFARRMGMLKNVAAGENGNITYDTLEKLISNVLMSSYVESVGTVAETDNNENVLYKVFGIYKISGMMTANAATTLTTPSGVGANSVRIENEVFKVSEKIYPELSRKLGYHLNLWVDEEDNDTIICYEEGSRNDITEIFSEDFEDWSNGVLKYTSGSKTKTESIPATATIIYNGRAADTVIDGDVFDGKWGNILLIEPDGKRIETVIITAYENYFAGKIDAEEFAVYDNGSDNRSISFKDNGQLSELAYFTRKTGEKISFSDIAVNSVLSVAQNGNYFDVIVTNETVTGVVKLIDTDEDEPTKILIDANMYVVAPEMEAARIADIRINNTYTFYLDAGARIAAGIITSSESKGMDWAYLINMSIDEESNDLYFKMLTRSGQVTNLKCAERIKIDGISYKSDRKPANIMDEFLLPGSEDIIKSQIIRMEIDDDACVKTIDTIKYNYQKENKTDSVRMICDNNKDRIYKAGTKMFGTDFALADNVAIFSIPEGKSNKADKGTPDEYGVVSNTIWTSDVNYRVSAYNTDIYSPVAGAVITTGGGQVPTENQDYLTLITSIKETIDDENEVVVELKGIQNNAEKRWYLESNDVAKISAKTFVTATAAEIEAGEKTISLRKGDAIKFATDMDDKIVKIELLYDCSEQVLSPSLTGIETYAKSQVGFGRVYRIANGYITTAIRNDIGVDSSDNTYVVSYLRPYRVYEVDVSGKYVTIDIVTSDAIKDWYNYGSADCSSVLIQNRYNEGRTIVIYHY